ncbi:hypothetical protein [Mesobacillus subterraneus]|uniref:hypothetical protein n=1 Tax=Mesobacillus subterraneus TaxID=285983 RepID=UPI001CFD9819|nr:hypothetical protein [Mesobacillus subterraneus]
MKKAKLRYLFIIVLLMLSACNSSDPNEAYEVQKVKKEEKKISSEKVSENETTVIDIPVQIGAHPRCCLGINIQKAEIQSNPDLIIMELELRTLLGNEEGITDTNLYLGYKDMIPAFNLLTDQGVYEAYLLEPEILVDGETKVVKVIFPDAKGNILGLSIRRIFEESQVLDEGYRNADSQGTFAYLEYIDDEMMRRIGRGMFDKVTSIELAKTKEEADEILKPLFHQEYRPDIYDILFEEITYGEYSKYDIKYLDETIEFKDKGAFIQYQANVEVTLYDETGAISRTKGFGVNSLISISPVTGNYTFSALDYDYLTGTDSYWDVGD